MISLYLYTPWVPGSTRGTSWECPIPKLMDYMDYMRPLRSQVLFNIWKDRTCQPHGSRSLGAKRWWGGRFLGAIGREVRFITMLETVSLRRLLADVVLLVSSWVAE